MSFPSNFTVISTFSGCGGSSLGYHLAGGRVLLAVERDANAVATYRLNFPDTPIYHGDIKALSSTEALQLSGVKIGELDILDGSPPCQGFSTAGKRNLGDDRNQLFREFTRLLTDIRPRTFVMENVSGMVKGKMRVIFVEILHALKKCGYHVSARLMNAMYFNVPQSRQRLIFIGVRDDLDIEPSHPHGTGRVVTVRESIGSMGEIEQTSRPFTPLKLKRYHETPKGGSHHLRFGMVRCAWNKPAQTILRISGSGGHCHPDEPRLLSIGELKRLASFPAEFRFVGTFDDAVNRIGNSVPPLFMKAIAEHIRDNILSKVAP